MKLLSSLEELLLLVIISLGENAYGVTIWQKLSKVTGKDWSIGSIYDPLYRLEKGVHSLNSFRTYIRQGRTQ